MISIVSAVANRFDELVIYTTVLFFEGYSFFHGKPIP